MKRFPVILKLFLVMALFISGAQARAQAPDSATVKLAPGNENSAMAQQLQNPVSTLISLPFQSNHDYNIGPNRGYKHTLNIQPVMPVSISRNWKMVVRVILPVIHQQDVIGDTEQDGIGDAETSLFFSPKVPGKHDIVWGIGPAILIPTASDKLLGTEKLGLGPTMVVFKQKGPFTGGLLAHQLWSVAGAEARSRVRILYVQPFFSHTSKTAFTLNLSGENTYNQDSEKLTSVVIFGFSQLVKYRQQPLSLGLHGRTFFGPEGSPAWGWRFVATFLFQAGGMKK